MYEHHFGFTERPFQLNPDPAFLYQSKKHSLAIAMLEYGLASGSPIIVTTGEIGAGKTTLIRYLLGRMEDSITVGLISNTHQSFGELIEWVAFAFGLETAGKDKVALYRNFGDFVIAEYARGHRTLLIIDEAQNLDPGTLEELRLLTNINAEKDVLFQIVLVGQPELRETLRLKRLEQFAQRIAVDFHLEALNLRETREYIQHRTMVAGGAKNLFLPDAIIAVFQHSQGVPRLINALCDMALVYAFSEGRSKVSGKLVHELIAERHEKGLFGAGAVKPQNTPKAGNSDS